MLNPSHPLSELLRRDQRYHFDSYVFVFDSLRYAQERLNMGQVVKAPPGRNDGGDYVEDFDDDLDDDDFDGEVDDLDYDELDDDDRDDDDELSEIEERAERHVTGQDLCEAMRQYALSQYGLMARCVLNHWGIRSTDDFGEIVFNLIDIGQMRKTDNDRREDFNDVFDFATALADGAVFTTLRETSTRRERPD